MIEIALWGSLGLIVLTYVVFPALILLRGRVFQRSWTTADITPRVSLVIAAHNEVLSIGRKLENVLALDYPRSQLEVIVASDGSDDGTQGVVARYAGDGVLLLSLPRRGKAAALNAAVARSTGEILVFSDANSQFTPDALGALVRPFADPEVGGVAGNQRYHSDGSAPASGDGERHYWDLDRLLKSAEAAAGSAVSATGAIYAIRRSLFQDVPDGVTDDFVTSTRVVAQHKRLVFEPAAVAFEPVAKSSHLEFGRKVRIATRGLRGVYVMRDLLNPLRHGVYSLQLLWHKVLRRLMVFPLLFVLLLNPFLLGKGNVYQWSMALQGAFYGCAVVYALLRNTRWGRIKLLSLPFYFCLVNAAALVATWNIARGYRIDLWEPKRAGGLQRGGG